MSVVLVLTAAVRAEHVLPALGLLGHTTRMAPLEPSALIDAPPSDVVLVDARSELAEVRALCRVIRATGLAVPLIAVVTEGGLAALTAEWGVDDVVLVDAGPAEVEARLRLTAGRLARARVGSSRVDLQACKLEYSIVSPK